MAAGAGALVEAAGVLGEEPAVLGGVLAGLAEAAGLGVAAGVLDEVGGAVSHVVASGVVTRERVVG